MLAATALFKRDKSFFKERFDDGYHPFPIALQQQRMTPIRHIYTTPQTDEELLISFQQNGDQNTLASLYLRYSELVYGVCLKYLSEAETAKDAVMNIYTELLKKLPYQQIITFKSWLYVFVKNYCLMQLRSNKMRTVEFQPDIVQSEDFMHLDNVLEKEAQFKKLEACLNTLADEQSKAVRLFYLDGKCYNEISESMSWNWSKVRSLIQNGRRNLKTCMEKNG